VIALEATALSEDPDFIQARLGHARRRLDEAMPYSPDWDAAAEAVDDLKQRLERALRRAGPSRLTEPGRSRDAA
jgi:hypothetical protein